MYGYRFLRLQPIFYSNKPGTREENEETDDASDADDPEELSEETPVTFEVGSYLAAVYQGNWYVGQVLNKKEEAMALQSGEYIYLSYMEPSSKRNLWKWPVKVDKLNTHINDVLCSCSAPTPSSSTSSTRSVTYTLDSKDKKRVLELFAAKDSVTPLFPVLVLVLFRTVPVPAPYHSTFLYHS